jgi:hypothetical protein
MKFLLSKKKFILGFLLKKKKQLYILEFILFFFKFFSKNGIILVSISKTGIFFFTIAETIAGIKPKPPPTTIGLQSNCKFFFIKVKSLIS